MPRFTFTLIVVSLTAYNKLSSYTRFIERRKAKLKIEQGSQTIPLLTCHEKLVSVYKHKINTSCLPLVSSVNALPTVRIITWNEQAGHKSFTVITVRCVELVLKTHLNCIMHTMQRSKQDTFAAAKYRFLHINLSGCYSEDLMDLKPTPRSQRVSSTHNGFVYPLMFALPQTNYALMRWQPTSPTIPILGN